MAQIVLHADLYPNGTDLKEFLPDVSANSVLVTEIGATGRKYWRYNTFGGSYPKLTAELSEFEVLLLSDMTATEIGALNVQRQMHLRFPGWNGFTVSNVLYYGVRYTDATTAAYNVNTYDTPTTNVSATPISDASAAGMRFAFSGGNTVKLKAWGAAVGGLEAAEPVGYDYEATTNRTLDRAVWPGVADSNSNARPGCYTSICIGTEGDSAPYPNNTQAVVAPTGLAVSNITESTADVDWT